MKPQIYKKYEIKFNKKKLIKSGEKSFTFKEDNVVTKLVQNSGKSFQMNMV